MIDNEKAFLLILVNNLTGFDETCIRPEYLLNQNYKNMFSYLQENYRKNKNINYLEISEEHKDFNYEFYLDLQKNYIPIENWQKSLKAIENDIIENYKFAWIKKLSSSNMTFADFKSKIDELSKIDATGLKYYKTTSEIDLTKINETIYIKSGINQIDKFIKGFALGELSVWSGGNGSGKSTLLSQLAIESINKGFKTLIFSGELRDVRLVKWMNLQICGKHNLYHNEKFDYYYPKEIPTNITNKKLFIYDNEIGNDINKIIYSIYDAVKKEDVKMIILDNLMSMNLASYGEQKYDVQTRLITELSNLAKQLNIHIHFVCHPRKSTNFLRKYDIAGTADLTNIADNVFIVHRVNNDFIKATGEMFKWNKDNEIYEYDNIVEICKNREDGIQDMFIGTYFEKETKRFLNYKDEEKYYM